MCERDSCELATTTMEKATSGECKCQANCNKQQKNLRKSHHNATEPNVNMQQQQQSQQIHTLPITSTSLLDSSSSSISTDSHFSGVSPPSSPLSTPSIGVNLRVTGQCSQGGRKYMEDYFSVAYQQSENAKDLEYAFIGIFDGHGGAEAATFAKEHLMMEIINQKHFWSDSDQDILRAIREGYIATHYAMWREQENWPKTANGLLSTAGTTATIAFIRREKIYIGHVGDSGIVLGYQNENEPFWRAKQLTTDHKPESSAERMRILRSGGKVVVKSGVPRVVWNRPRNAEHKGPIRRNTPVDEVPFLAVARSLGDLWSYNSAINEFVVSPDPDVNVIKINPNTFRCLIFGTDGLWNVVTPQEAVRTVFEKESFNERLQAQYARGGTAPVETVQWTNPSKGLVEKALKTWSSKKMRADNTSVVTVILYPPGSEACYGDVVGACDNRTEAGERILPQNGLSPQSCGFEYTQLNTEVITYQEMAEKYQPPEDYRNFNYFEDDAEMAVQSLYEQTHGEWTKACNKLNDIDVCESAADQGDDIPPSDSRASIEDGGGDDEDRGSDEDDESDDCEFVEERGVNNETIVTNYSTFMSDSSTNSLSTPENVGSYLSFAESYNSLLNEQMSQEANTSNSNASCRSINTSSMHEILQEQQMYQQQCMSEEEGYSLTKLETRREQCCSGVQTFKIFQQSVEAATTSKTEGSDEQHESQATAEPKLFYGTRYPTISAAINKFSLFQQHQQSQQQQEQTIELHSLLQQERDEEEQVALERLQIQMDLEATRGCHGTEDETVEGQSDDDEKELGEEYLEEDLPLVQPDATVQVNVVSSSSLVVSQADNDSGTLICGDNAILLGSNRVGSFEKIDAIETVHEGVERLIAMEPLEDPPSASIVQLKHTRSKRAQFTRQPYPNIPNENQRRMLAENVQQPQKRRRYNHEPVGSSTAIVKTTKPTRANTMEKRQLRSSGCCGSGIYDYAKCTLRTRNSLAKDMKAKHALTAATLKRPAGAAQFLRATAVNLISSSGNGNSTNSPQPIAVGRSSNDNNNTTRSNNTSRKQKASTSMTTLPHGINLRSRHVGGQASAKPSHFSKLSVGSASGGSSSGCASVNGGSRRREQHNLRSASLKRRSGAKELTSSGGCLPSNTCFSKSTRSYAVPPPSPKLMHAAVASAAATRARSLLTTRNAASASLFSARTAILGASSCGNTVARTRTACNAGAAKKRRDAA